MLPVLIAVCLPVLCPLVVALLEACVAKSSGGPLFPCTLQGGCGSPGTDTQVSGTDPHVAQPFSSYPAAPHISCNTTVSLESVTKTDKQWTFCRFSGVQPRLPTKTQLLHEAALLGPYAEGW